MRKPFVAGNWKMNLSLEEGIELVKDLYDNLSSFNMDYSKIDIAVCAPYVYLKTLNDILLEYNRKFSLNLQLGAQNMHWEEKGAFTGEISPKMLKDIGCTYVILGHSERRSMFYESDEIINKKVLSAFKYGLLPIVCIGETLEQREKNQTLEVIRTQLENSLANLTPAQMEVCTIAYEPVWAIGTGKSATPEMAEEVHIEIRKYLEEKYNKEISEKVRIQYGGSVKPTNTEALMSKPNIDGALVGGASLKGKDFSDIINLTYKVKIK